MKNNTLLVMALLISSVAFGQLETYITETGGVNDPIIYTDPNNQEMPPCGENNDSNAFENGKSCTKNLNRIVANDFMVNGGETLTLETILVNVFIGATGSGVNASSMDIYYYTDNNGEPGSVIGGEFDSFISSQSVIGSNFGFDVWQIEMDVTDHVFHDSGGSNKKYWIGLSIEATDGSNLFWENASIGLNGSGEAYDDGLGGGYVVDPALEGVYVFTGDCVPRLGIDDNFADQVQLYPNPVSDGVITISTPTPGEKQVTVFDILGKQVIETEIMGNQLDLSSLQGGVYLLKLTQNNVTVTKKLVVR
jgi:hypothetical protein